MYPTDRQRRPRIDCTNAAVCYGAAQHSRVQHPLTREVSHIFAVPAQEAQILYALNRGADVTVDCHNLLALRREARACPV